MPKSLSFSTDSGGAEHILQPHVITASPVNLYQINTSMPPNTSRPSQLTGAATETTGLLSAASQNVPRYTKSTPTSPRSTRQISRVNSMTESLRLHRYSSRRYSGLSSPVFMRSSGLRTPKINQSFGGITYQDERVWYDQFTSTDWVHDSIADGFRVLELRKIKGFRGRILRFLDSAQGWTLVALIGCLTASVAYFVDITESAFFDVKRGYCQTAWYHSRAKCCAGQRTCDDWRPWSQLVQSERVDGMWIDYLAFIVGCVVFAALSCALTLYSKTVVPAHIASTFDEDLGATKRNIQQNHDKDEDDHHAMQTSEHTIPPNIYYSAAGSGVAEVKVILSGFVLHGYLGLKTLALKTTGLVLSVASGMSLGKEGPYVHIATCIGNVACRLFPKYNLNDGKRREVLSASAASGVAVAFGSPLGGVLFSLEEVSYYFPPKTLFRTFFCCIAAALSLKFLNPYGTSKIVLFEVRYVTDWRFFELFIFAFVGVAGGVAGALFIKASRFWATTFRRIRIIKAHPMLEVVLVALVTGLASFWNRYLRLAVTELLFELTSPCEMGNPTGLCPLQSDIPKVIRYLSVAFIVKSILTIITFGLKIPAGIYVPSMVVGGLMGRIVGHTVQYIVLQNPDFFLFSSCPKGGGIESCVTPGVYALVAAGATMCGVTRLSVTLAVILFELTGSLDHVLPFSIAVLVAKWAADAVEPLSIYDLLTDMNSYPFLDNKASPVFDSELSDITPRFRRDKVIDITISPFVKATDLRTKLNRLQNAGELDGGLPIIRDKVLVGLIPAPDLEFALDRVENEDRTLCLMSSENHPYNTHYRGWGGLDDDDDDDALDSGSDNEEEELMHSAPTADLTVYIDPAPVSLDVHSPMDLVYQCFVKLGLRYICVLSDGEFRGLVHKKAFVRYVKTMEHGG